MAGRQLPVVLIVAVHVFYTVLHIETMTIQSADYTVRDLLGRPEIFGLYRVAANGGLCGMVLTVPLVRHEADTFEYFEVNPEQCFHKNTSFLYFVGL